MKQLITLICFLVTLVSCSEYQRVLNNDNVSKKYAMADSLYAAGKYLKAVRLMEQIVPAYRGKPQAEKLMFIYANSYYKLDDHFLSGYQFERFVTSYPKSDSVEIAAYKSARSYYELSPVFSLEQKETHQALEKLQEFINGYPNSPKRDEANKLVAELRGKLDKKSYETANQYFRISDFKAAIGSFDNFIKNHPGSKYRKDAFFGRFNAAYKLAINSFPSLVEERLKVAKEHYESFAKYYKDSDLAEAANTILEDINKRLQQYPNS